MDLTLYNNEDKRLHIIKIIHVFNYRSCTFSNKPRERTTIMWVKLRFKVKDDKTNTYSALVSKRNSQKDSVHGECIVKGCDLKELLFVHTFFSLWCTEPWWLEVLIHNVLAIQLQTQSINFHYVPVDMVFFYLSKVWSLFATAVFSYRACYASNLVWSFMQDHFNLINKNKMFSALISIKCFIKMNNRRMLKINSFSSFQ